MGGTSLLALAARFCTQLFACIAASFARLALGAARAARVLGSVVVGGWPALECAGHVRVFSRKAGGCAPTAFGRAVPKAAAISICRFARTSALPSPNRRTLLVQHLCPPGVPSAVN